MKKELLRTFQLTLKQSDSASLSELYFQVFAGEHCGILFNSFKERDIFMSFLEGNLAPAEGFIYFDEQPVSYREYTRLSRLKINIIMEKSRLMNSLSVYENLFYDKLTPAWLSSKNFFLMTENLLYYFHLSIIPTQKVSTLTSYERIAVELIKGFLQKKKIIFLSNISAVIDKRDFQSLLQLIGTLEKHGTTFIFSDTFNTQLFKLTNALYIIKNGQITRILEGHQIKQSEIQKSFGSYSVLHNQNEPDYKSYSNEAALSFAGITYQLILDLSFTLKKGKVIKLFCSTSQQANDLKALVTKSLLPEKGKIAFYGQNLNNLDNKAFQKRYALISPNPRQTSIFHNMSVLDNICLPLDRKMPGLLSSLRYKKAIAYELKDIIPAEYLSMNIDDVPVDVIQKTIYCKWLLYTPDLLICMNPFSMIDSSLNQITGQLLELLTHKGIPVMIISNNWSMDINISGDTYFL